MRQGFETTRTTEVEGKVSSASPLVRYRPQIIVSILVIVFLSGGAFYAARGTEKAPKVVYSASLEEIRAESNQPLKINLNSANLDELDELPGVGPSTAQAILDHRESNGMFRTVDELEEVSGIGPKTLEEIKPFAGV